MSTTIDEKVVEMRFDNRDFEKNVKTSMDTLSNLKNSLRFDDAAKSFGNLEKASRGVKFDGLSNAIETVKLKFSGLQIAATRIISNIVDDAYYAGKRIVRSLSFDQISAGWSKYADKTTAVQTIMASTAKDFEDTGEQMEFVNGELEKLNWFTDETSYNFLDMVNNIGKFTSNNVKLEDAVTAMEGISNWAAISGQGVNEASRAMYNLSQALAMGEVKLMDWRSIQNANMATYEFKQQVIDVAEALGTVKKKGEDAYQVGSKTYTLLQLFDDGLSKGWFTSDVLIKTLEKYGGFTNVLHDATDELDLTATEFLEMLDKYMKGTLDINEAAKETGSNVVTLSKWLKELSTDEYDVGRRAFIAAQEAKTFKEALDSVKDAASTVWMNIFEDIFGDYLTAKKEWTALANELYDVFVEPLNAKHELFKMWAQMGGNTTMLKSFVNIWTNLKNIVTAVKDGIRDIFPPATIKSLMTFTSNFKDLTERLMVGEAALDKIRRTARGLAAVLDIGRMLISAIWGGVKQLFSLFKPLGGSLLDTSANIGDFLVKLRDWIKENEIFVRVVNRIIDAIKLMASGIDNLLRKLTGYGVVDLAKKLGDNLSYAYQKISLILKLLFGHNTPKQISELVHRFKELTGMDFKDSKLFKFFSRMKNIFVGLRTMVSDLIHGVKFGDAIKKFFGSSFGFDPEKSIGGFGKVWETFKNAWSKITETFNSFKAGFGDFAEIIKKRWDGIKDAFSSAKTVIVDAWKKIKEVMSEVTGTDLSGMSKLATVLSVLLYPIQLLFTALKYLFQGLGIIIEDFGPSIMNFLKKVGEGFVNFAKKIGEGFKNADFNKVLELITSGSLAVILGKLAASLLGFSKISKNLGKMGSGKGGKFSIFAFLKNLATSGKEIISKIGESVSAILDSVRGVLVAWQRDLQANVLFKIGAAILMLASALVILSGIDKESLTTAIGAITALFTELVAAFKLISGSMVVDNTLNPGKNGITNILAGYTQLSSLIISMAAAVLIMSVALKKVASLDKDQLKTGIIGITAIFSELTAFLILISKNVAKSEIAIKGVVKLALALYIMAMAVKKLSKLDSKEMLQGIGGIGLILLELLAFIRLIGIRLKGVYTTAFMANYESIAQIASGILILAVALKLMVSSVKKLGKMDPKALEQGLIGFAGILGAIDAFVYLFKSPGAQEAGIMRIASMMMVMSVAMVLMASAMKIMGTMDFEHMAVATLGFVGVIGTIVVAFNAVNSASILKTAGAMIIMANAMIPMALAMRIMGTMDFEHMAVATLGFLGALGTLIIGLNYLQGQALQIVKLSGAITILANAMVVMGIAMKIMSTIDAASMIKVVTALGFIFGEMSLFSAFTEGLNAIKAAAAIVILANALMILAPVLMLFKLIDMDSVLKMAVALGSVMIILGAAAVALQNVMLPLLAISGSLALFGVGILALGAGFTLLAAGLTALGGSLPILVKFLEILATALLTFIPNVIISFFKTVLKAIIDFGKDILLALLGMLNAILPPLVELIFNFTDALMAALAAHLPNITRNLINLILDMLEIIGDNAFRIVDGLLDLAFKLIDGFGEAFKKNIRRAVNVISDLLVNILAGAFDLLFGWFGDFITGKTEDVVKNVEDLLTEEEKKVVDHVREMIKTYEELDKTRDTNLNSINSEYKYIQELGEEYNTLIDANGKVKKGSEDRAEVILTTLAKAMGIERDEIDKLIDKNGKLGESYYDVISAMQAKAYMEANEETYKEAIRNRTEVNDEYIKSLNEYNKSNERYKTVLKDLAKAEAEYYGKVERGEGWDKDLFNRIDALEQEKTELEGTVPVLHRTYERASELNSKYATEIFNYEGMMLAVQKGNIDAMKQFMYYYNTGLITSANGNEKVLTNQVNTAKAKLDELKYAYEHGYGEVTEADVQFQKDLYERTLKELHNFQNGIKEDSYNFGDDVVDETAKGILDGKGKLTSASMKTVEGIEGPYEDMPADMSNYMDDSTKAMLEKYGINANELTSMSEETGEEIPKKLNEGVNNNLSKVTKAGNNVADSMVKPIKDKSKLMRGIGNDYVDGFVQGASSKPNISKVEQAAIDVAAHFMSIVQKTGDAHSPSRKMAEIGTWFVQGFVLGINKLKSLVGVSSEDVANTSIDAMTETLSLASDIFSSDLDVDPTIRPVVDLSGVTSGVSAINGMFGSSRALKLTGNISRDSKAAITARLQNGVDVNNSDVVSELGKLRKDVTDLNQSMSRMQIIMDTGALVGQISSPLDASLGRRTLLKQRGV